MTNNIFNNSYTEKDYESIRKKLVEIIPNLTDKWTDFNESDPGMAYLEIASGLTDMLCYYLDRQALENYLTTVEQRKNCKSILSTVGYKMYEYRSSVCRVEFTLDSPHTSDIVIPLYTRMIANKNTPSEAQFNTMSEVIIDAGETEVEVDAKEGVLKTKKITVGDLTRFRYKLPELAVAEDSIKIFVDVGDGIELEEVQDIFLYGVGGLYFSTVTDKDGYTWLNFMPDWTDHVNVTNDTELEIKYLISSGVRGQAKTGEVNEIYNSTIYDSEEINVTNLIVVENTENASGGSDPETIAEASFLAPRVTQTMWTAVTLQDFITLAYTIPGIRIVNAIDWSDHYGYYTTPSTVEICLVPEIGEVASSFLKESLLNLLEERKLVALDIIIIDPTYVEFNINAKVIVKDRLYPKDEIERAIKSNLTSAYSSDNAQFNVSVRKSKIVSLMHEAHPTIGYVELTTPANDIVLKSNELSKLVNINLNILYSHEAR